MASYEQQDSYFWSDAAEYPHAGTLVKTEFNADTDAQSLRKAMKGLGTDEHAIINVLGYRNTSQRLEIVLKYKTLFGKDLRKDLSSELSGNFNRVCQALCLSPIEYDCQELRRSMKGAGTDEDTLIEIICTRTSEQLRELKTFYGHKYTRNLEKDIISETSGHFRRLMVSLLQCSRDETTDIQEQAVREDAEKLYNAGEKKWGTDESMFNQILSTRSNTHLRAVFKEYEKLASKTLEESIKSEMSGDLCRGMLTIVRCIQYKPAYFAKALYDSMKGLGTDDQTLLRIVVTRCEIDMVQIKASFEAQYNVTLKDFIKSDASGDFCKILLALIGEEK